MACQPPLSLSLSTHPGSSFHSSSSSASVPVSAVVPMVTTDTDLSQHHRHQARLHVSPPLPPSLPPSSTPISPPSQVMGLHQHPVREGSHSPLHTNQLLLFPWQPATSHTHLLVVQQVTLPVKQRQTHLHHITPVKPRPLTPPNDIRSHNHPSSISNIMLS